MLDSSPEGFSWIDSNDAAGNTLSFLRFATPAPSEAPPPPPAPSGLVARQAADTSPDGAPAPAARAVASPAAAPAPASTAPSALTDPIGFPPSGFGATTLACVANFSGGPHENYKIGLPHAGRWVEVLNTDAAIYGGSGVGNLGAVEAVEEEWHGRPASATIIVPPLGVLWLAPES